MAKFSVEVEMIVSKLLTLEAPNKGAVEDFFNDNDDYVAGSIIEMCGAIDEGVSMGKIGEIKEVKPGSANDYTPDFCVNSEGEACDDLGEEEEEDDE